MSVYCPDPKTLYPARLADGWWIMDKHGPLSGPYASVRDVNRGIADARDAQDARDARTYLEGRLWPQGPRCPVCGLGERITTRAGGFYRCNQCKEDFTVRTGTIFERSHVPLHKWIYAMYLLVTARKGISSLQLAKEIGITQKSAWFVLHRLREACGGDLEKLQGLEKSKEKAGR